MGRVSVGRPKVDIKGGDNAKRQRNIRLKGGQTQEEKEGQEEKVNYNQSLDLENSCIPNVFGKQPCWTIGNNIKHYAKKNMKTARVTDISLSVIGDEYLDYLKKHIDQMPDWKYWVLTDRPEEVRKVLTGKRHVIVPYNKPRFNYFDKLLWALDSVIETGRPTLQIDVRRLTYRLHVVENFIDDVSLVNALFNQPVYPNSCYHLAVWSPGAKAQMVPVFTNLDLRFGLNYWKPIIQAMGKDIDKWSPIVEHAILFSVTKEKAEQIRKDLVQIEPLFRQQSLEEKNPYKGVSSGEGLALGWSLHKNSVDTRPLLTVQQLNMHNPMDYTEPWDNANYTV